MARKPKDDRIVDIGTIAEALGVSKTTVSRAISGNGRVGPATRQRVQDYVKEHNYTPSVMARGLALRCSYNIALVISKQVSEFEMALLRKTMRSVYQVAEDRPAGARPAGAAADIPPRAVWCHRPSGG